MRFEEVYTDIIKRLENELPAALSYHQAQHTRSVTAAAEQLGAMEGLTGQELLLLRTAALFHDTGFLKTYEEHEAASCELAREVLPAYGYRDQDIDAICGWIMATRLPQAPKDKPAQVLCDADLHYLGTDRYEAIAESLFNELMAQGEIKTREEWKAIEKKFLTAHHYFTAAAIKAYGPKKEANRKQALSGRHQDHPQHGFASTMQDIVFILLGVFTAGFGLKGFLVPNQFFDGGISGLSLLLHELYHFNLALTILILSLPLLVVSYFSIGKAFALKTLLCVILLGVCLQIHYPVVTSDKLLISIFGGVFLGIGIGLAMRAGCALDGIEVLALYTLKRSSFTITEIILGFNILIFGVAAFKFGVETALYSILTYFTASKVTDYVVEGIQAYTGVTIISVQSEAIKHRLVNELGRGITVYKGERGFLPGSFDVSSDVDIVFTVVTRLEMRKLKNVVYDVDPKAFVFAHTIKEAAGGVLKRRPRH